MSSLVNLSAYRYFKQTSKAESIFFILCLIIFLVSACNRSNDKPNSDSKLNGDKDTTKLAANKEKNDSLTFYILSEDGKVLQTMKCRNYFNRELRYETNMQNNVKEAYNDTLDEKTYKILEDSITKLNRKKNPYIIDITTGDFNGDGKKEIAWLEAETKREGTGYVLTGKKFIRFSDNKIKRIPVEERAYEIINIGDIDGNSSDEIAYSVGYYMGNTESFVAYRLRQGKWECLVVVENTLNMREAGIKYLEKDTVKKGYCKLRIPLLFYKNSDSLIPEKYFIDSITQTYKLTPTFSHVVELSVKIK